MVKCEDRRVKYESWGSVPGNSDANCRLRLYKSQAGHVVVFTWDAKAAGTSITNQIEVAAKMVCEEYHLIPNSVLWFEHYVKGFLGRPSYKRVIFPLHKEEFLEPEWEEFTLPELEKMIGQPLD